MNYCMNTERVDKEDAFTEANYDLEMIPYMDTGVTYDSFCSVTTPLVPHGMDLKFPRQDLS